MILFYVALVNVQHFLNFSQTSLDGLCCNIFYQKCFYDNALSLYLLNLTFRVFKSLKLLASFFLQAGVVHLIMDECVSHKMF